ncbi:uncharacterized protein JCM10292_006544 [Rhodotorula paludigena]|uniref:uncharacterized protein n=1 Tax=Rhodotorula paludigena TaxID=86838 RepID=UPI00317D2271
MPARSAASQPSPPLLGRSAPSQGAAPAVGASSRAPGSAGASPAGTPPAASSQDPFLAQTAAIPLTEEDRQEGYDVGLLNARPRGRHSNDLGGPLGESDDDYQGREKYGSAGLAPVQSHAGLGEAAVPVGILGAGVGAGAGLGQVGSAPPGVYGAGGYGASSAAAKEYGADSAGGYSGATAQDGHRRPWYLRPLTLLILALFLVAVALAVGLGVGLSERDTNNDDARSRNDTFPGNRTSTRSRGTSESVTSGTVVPSTDTAYWATASTEDAETSSDALTSMPSSITAASPATATSLATSGNLPIPANSSTVISGSITIPALSSTPEPSVSTASAVRRVRRTRLYRE